MLLLSELADERRADLMREATAERRAGQARLAAPGESTNGERGGPKRPTARFPGGFLVLLRCWLARLRVRFGSMTPTVRALGLR